MKAGWPLVSVVIATNRDSPYFAQAIDSVVAQTYPDWEIVVVDNGVPDGDALAATVGKAPRSRVVRVPSSGTVSLARNAGVAVAAGELLVFLDDDDSWHEDRLRLQVDALAADPAAPASYCGGWHMDAASRPFAPSWPAHPATAVEMLAGRSRMPHICGAMMIRRDAYARVGGFSPELTMLEDFELALRLLGLGDLVCVPDELVGYRRHDRNATNTGFENIRFRRAAMDGILSRHAWAAAVRGDVGTARLLREHRSRERRRAAKEAASMTLAALRRGRTTDALQDARWGLAHEPAVYVAAIAGRVAGRR
ncbi:glycosyltransferase family 2 protein [Microbacterium kyungheense]|uniref:Glycosyltransferase involved in cell wall biosynthesis n=1 Tax=Microbacterium kyungheense TaxID=1263636 RepID=A0A543ERU7_9MICO|nr:glycosyltransferase family A protein [Microbacterium kyungheense]TQM24306.1 glycosyltransferase involved in cell wall biosynthesis [Microbacterium kyungheense]